jgi:hypothetical protein
MNNVFAVQVFNGITNNSDDICCILLVKLASLAYPIKQLATRTQVSDEVQIIRSFKVVPEGDCFVRLGDGNQCFCGLC